MTISICIIHVCNNSLTMYISSLPRDEQERVVLTVELQQQLYGAEMAMETPSVTRVDYIINYIT